MHVDAKGTVGRYPVLLVRTTLRHLRSRLQWGLAELETAAGLPPGNGRALVRVLRAEGLIEAVGRGIWTMTQAGVTFSAATAAQQVTRATAERTLSEFLERVTEVNQNPYFLAKVTTVVLFGSLLKPEVERLSDVDVAIEWTRKNPDFERARGQNQRRAEELANLGRGFRNVLEWEDCWYWEAFRFLKGRSRVIALADFNAEKTFVLAVPHRFLIGEPDHVAVQVPPTTREPAARRRRPRNCPF
jgi:predicted nucleotidyltransferase